MLVDFHMHTTFSDGKLTPTDLVKKAIDAQLQIIAITDHDEIKAYHNVDPSLLEHIHLISGTELSSTYHDIDVHILGYNFDTHNQRMNDYVDFYKNERHNRMIRMTEACYQEGYKVTFDELIEMFGPNASWGRPHLAQLLMKKGYVGSINEAFESIISHTSPCYIPKFQSQPKDMLNIIHEAGGLAVMAHPKLIGNDSYVEELLDLGFDGIEVYHSSHTQEDTLRYGAIAKERNLLVSGGSDFHGIKGRKYPDELGEYIITYDMVKDFINTIIPEVK